MKLTTNNGYSTMHSYPFITDGPKDDSSPELVNATETQNIIESKEQETPSGAIHLKPTWKPVKLDEKPPFSYATIIAHAILSSEDRKLTLSEIYQWISEKYPCYSMKDNRWQNSIRHNLSLQKAFVKLERDVSSTTLSSGKGCHWTILPGYEQQFIDNLLKRGLATSSSKSSTKVTAATSHKQFKKFIDNSSKRKSSHLFTIFRMNPSTPNETTAEDTTPNKKRRKVVKKQQVVEKKEPSIEYDSDCDSGIDLNCEVISKKEVPAFSTIPDYDTSSFILNNTMLTAPPLLEDRSINLFDDSTTAYFMDILEPPRTQDNFYWPMMQPEQVIDLSTNYQTTFYSDFYTDPSITTLLQNPSNCTTFMPLAPTSHLLYNGDFCL